MCGIESDYELLDNDFVYDYAQYIWRYLLENFAEKPKDKMISLNKACEWLKKNRDELSSVDTSGFIELFKKALEE